MLGAGVACFTYLNHGNNSNASWKIKKEDSIRDLTQERLAATFGWFGYGLLTTGVAASYFRHSFMMTSIHPIVWFTGCSLTIMGAHYFNYKTMLPLKALSYTGLNICMGMMLLPLL